ncbi:MAG: hypothetical protein AAF533_08000 [Acidobacteriota bacterium]
MQWSRVQFGLLASVLLVACGGGPGGSAPKLAPPEEFRWGGQPITFSPPSSGWRRQRDQHGGIRGVRFIKTGSVGEGIAIGEYYQLGDRDRCRALAEFLEEYDSLSRKETLRRVQKIRMGYMSWFSDHEERLASVVNEQLDEFRNAVIHGRMLEAERALELAQDAALEIRHELDDVVDEVLFRAEDRTDPHFYVVEEPVEGELAGEPSLSVSYTMERDRRTYSGRQVYVVRNNRLFVADFIGLAENLPLFDAVVQSITFPPGDCE